MNQVLLDNLAKLNISRKRRHKWQRIVSVFAVVVVFCTTYALILPAITMHRELLCCIDEHMHSADCGQSYICADALLDKTVIHSHDGLCYDSDGQLCCNLTELHEHIHTEDCTAMKLICGKDEAEAHTHGETCYELCDEAQCGMLEQEAHQHNESCLTQELNCLLDTEPVHQHGEGCYEQISTLSCGLAQQEGHSHGDVCLDENGELICGMDEISGHEHSEVCYTQETKLSCQISTEPHVHNESCYVIKTICGLPETEGHLHDESCYLKLICNLEEQEGHSHEDACWAESTCSLPEIRAHSHADSCWDEDAVLICQEPEVLIHQHDKNCIIHNCGMASHSHDETCYPQQETQTDGAEFLCGFGAHVHVPDCYDENEMLICSIPEHTHTAACILEDFDAQADTEDEAMWLASFADVQLTDNWAENIVGIARSQLGYSESARNVILLDDGSLKGYTRYGAWHGDCYADWNSLFAAFCLNYAGVECFPIVQDVNAWMQQLQALNFYRKAAEYAPAPGDLMFMDSDLDGYADRLAIVSGTADGTIQLIQGDVQGCVAELSFSADESQIIGYGIVPRANSRSLQVSQLDYSVEVLLHTNAMIPEDAQLRVEEILPDSEEYESYYKQSAEALCQDAEEESSAEIRFARFFDIRFVANGVTMEPAAPVDIRISYEQAVEIADKDQGFAIHFAAEGVEVLDVQTDRSEESQSTDSFAFTQSSFSVTGTVVAGSRAIDLSNALQLTDIISQIHVSNREGMETKIFANGDSFHIVMEGSMHSWQFTNGQSKTLYFNLNDTMRLESFVCSNGISDAMIDGSSNTFLMEVPAVSNGNTTHFRVELNGTATNQTGGISYVTIRWDQYQIYSSKQSFTAAYDKGITVTADIMGSSYSPSQYKLVLEEVEKVDDSAMNSIRNWVQNNYYRQHLDEYVLMYKVYLVDDKNDPHQQIPLPAPYTLVVDYAESPFEGHHKGSAAVVNMNNNSANTPGSSSTSYDNGLSKICIADQHSPLSQFAVVHLNGISTGTTASGYTLEYNDSTDAFLRDSAYDIYYRSISPIGTAGSFHIVAFGTANLNTHTNGNILAKNLNAYSNFGTNNYGDELTYVQNYLTVNSNSASSENHVLVLGSENVIGFYDNNNKYTVNGQGIDRPKTIIQDVDTASAPFIDLDRVRAEIVQISARLVGYPNQNITISQYSQKNVLKLTDMDGVGVLNVSATDPIVFGKDYIQLGGFSSGHDGSIVINVDCSGTSQITMPKALVVVDGQEQSTNEVTEFSNGKVLWNFINAHGVTINTHLMTGMIIAPGATVNIQQNLNGTVVADVVNVNAESHRTDFTGKIVPRTNSEGYSATIQKVRTGYMGTTLASAEFDLYFWNGSNWQKVNAEPIVTNSSGLFMLDNLQPDTAYQLVETKAPEGYVAMDKPYGFWVRSNTNTNQPSSKPSDFTGEAVSSGAVLNISNDLDETVKTTSLEIQKLWDTPESPKVTHISVTVYQLSWKNQQLVEKKEYRSIPLSSVLNWKTTLSDLPLSLVDSDGSTIIYTYAVEEIPLEGYTASYSVDKDVGVSEGIITITNKVKGTEIEYILPETGGNGTVPYTLAGLAFICFAAFNLLFPSLMANENKIHCISNRKRKGEFR